MAPTASQALNTVQNATNAVTSAQQLLPASLQTAQRNAAFSNPLGFASSFIQQFPKQAASLQTRFPGFAANLRTGLGIGGGAGAGGDGTPEPTTEEAATQGFDELFGGVPDIGDISSQIGQQQDLLSQNTARQSELLRQLLGGQEQASGQRLKRALAQRGILDSGSLGAGLSQIATGTGEQLSQGVQRAQMQENQAVVNLITDANNRIQEQQDRLFDAKQRAIEFMGELGLSFDQLSQQDKQFFADLDLRTQDLQAQGDRFLLELGQRQGQIDDANKAAELTAVKGILAPSLSAGPFSASPSS